MSAVMSADLFGIFTGIKLQIDSFIAQFKIATPDDVEIHHTLENLALIATGKSARTLSGQLGSGIIGAIKSLKSGEKEKQTLRVEIDKDAVKALMEKGYYDLQAE